MRGFRNAQDPRNIQVGPEGITAFANSIAFVSFEPVQGKSIFFRIDRDGAHTQLSGRAKYSNGYFAAIRNEQAPDCLRHGASPALFGSTV